MNIGGFCFEVISEKPSKDNAKREENKIKGRFFDFYAQLKLKGVYKTNLSLSLGERGCFLFEIRTSPSGRQSKLIPLHSGEG